MFVLLDDSLNLDQKNSFLYRNPIREIRATSSKEVSAAFSQIEEALAQGHYVVGYFCYELGKVFQGMESSDQELLRFFVFESEQVLCSNDVLKTLEENSSVEEELMVSGPRPSIDDQNYERVIRAIKKEIAQGNTYQVNYTFPCSLDYRGSEVQVYELLKKQQKVSYGALLSLEDKSVFCYSPELFMEKKGRQLRCRPMKGTWSKSASSANIEPDDKNKAENIMIVDLLRSDMGKISIPGSVQVSSLFEMEEYETLYQMTSTIESSLKDSLSIKDIFEAMFPCGSITGAPKKETMRVIDYVETEPRGIYTGAIGVFRPNGDFTFNVPIRTLIGDKQGRAQLQVGSGIIYEAEAASEYKECLDKFQFVGKSNSHFSLLETLRLEGGEYLHLTDHLMRLQDSCSYFGFSFSKEDVMTELEKTKDYLGSWKVRISLKRCGSLQIEKSPLDLEQKEWTCTLAKERIDSKNPLRRHKTSLRGLYERELQRAQSRGANEAVFLNEFGHIAEACNSAILFRHKGEWFSPATECGALPSVGLKTFCKEQPVSFGHYSLEEWLKADEHYLMNSLRGLRKVVLDDSFCR